MIQSIKMNNFAVYNRETQLSGCRKINLIYGNNGSGKTILSNYLLSPDSTEYKDCSILWDDDLKLPIYVYNKKFCDNNFSGTDIPGIYTMGSLNVETEKEAEVIEKQITFNNKQLMDLQQDYDNISKQLTALQNACIDAIWEQSKTYKQLLGDCFKRGSSKVQLFNKVLDYRPTNHQPISLLELKQKAEVLNSQNEIQYAIFTCFDDSEFTLIESDSIWNDSYSVDVSQVFPRSEKTDWKYQGLKYLNENNICPFCEQPILSGEFQTKLSYLKSDNFHKDIERCSQLLERYKTYGQRLLANAERILKSNRYEGAAFIDTDQFSDILTNLRNLFHANMLFMQQKRDSFSKQVEIQSSAALIAKLNQCIEESNYRASDANHMLMNLRRSKNEIQQLAWVSFCDESAEDVRNYQRKIIEPERKLQELESQINTLTISLQELEQKKDFCLRNSINIRASVDKINAELSSLGINNFCLQLSDDEKHYIILRQDGEICADSLSEGECSLIMLLYFLQLAEGSSSKDTPNKKRIIVIDDPVSNLDDTLLNAVMFRIGLLISKILDGSNIQQIFVLSHRKECTKKLRACDNRLDDNQNVGLWILKKKDGTTTINEYIL